MRDETSSRTLTCLQDGLDLSDPVSFNQRRQGWSFEEVVPARTIRSEENAERGAKRGGSQGAKEKRHPKSLDVYFGDNSETALGIGGTEGRILVGGEV